MDYDPIMQLASGTTLITLLITTFLVGWAMPRGRHLKRLQLRVLKAIHNFFADEEEYIQHKVDRIRSATNAKRNKQK